MPESVEQNDKSTPPDNDSGDVGGVYDDGDAYSFPHCHSPEVLAVEMQSEVRQAGSDRKPVPVCPLIRDASVREGDVGQRSGFAPTSPNPTGSNHDV